MTSDTAHKHAVDGPRDLVASFVTDQHYRARWAPDGARVEIGETNGRTMLSATGKGDWCAAFAKLDDLVNALKDNPHEISITRLVNHPVDRVFAAFSNPAGMAAWWGPNGFTTTTKTMAFKVGGVWKYVMHGPDGTNYPNHVRYTKIEKDRLIAYDHGTDADHPGLFKAEIRFTAEGSSTRVTLKLTLKDAAERPTYIRFGAVEGGYQNLERLEKWLAGSPASNPGDRT